MAISAHIEVIPGRPERSREPRHRIMLAASGTLPSGEAADVMVHNISASGTLVQSPLSLDVGEALTFELPGADAVRATVVWTSGDLYGCKFDAPVSKAVLSSAQLRSAVGQQVDTSGRGVSPGHDGTREAEPFGMRLRRLRKERGLSLAKVAAELGVSKPTVWAWEQGRARPAQERIDLLARALGTSSATLQAGRDDRVLHDMLERSRRQIADAYLTLPENVRIMIEL